MHFRHIRPDEVVVDLDTGKIFGPNIVVLGPDTDFEVCLSDGEISVKAVETGKPVVVVEF